MSAMATHLAVWFVCVAQWDAASAVDVEVLNGVYKLEDTNFEAAIAKNPTMMLNFYGSDCSACDALKPTYEKAAKKLKKMEKGPRLGKVDVAVEEGIVKKFGIVGVQPPALVVLKDGKNWRYEGALETEEIFKYMECVALPFLPGDAARVYCAAHLAYKDVLRKILPGKVRRYLFKWFAFPIVMLLPFLTILCCACCCRGGNKKVSKPANGKATKGKATKGKAAKGDAKAKPNEAGENDKDEAENEKDNEEKKDD